MMTIDRMLRRGIFPILSERPLDESETAAPATAKVYVVEVGAYSDRYIDAIFATRELAEAYVLNRRRRSFERDGRKAHQRVASWHWGDLGVLAGTTMTFGSDGRAFDSEGHVVEAEAVYEDVPAETFEEFLKRHTWNEFGDVEEYDLWDMLPVVEDGRE